MAKIPQPRMTKTSLSAFCGALAAAIGDIEYREPAQYEKFWKDLHLHVTHFSRAIPEDYASHRAILWDWFTYLREMDSSLREHLASLSEPEHLAGLVDRVVLEQLTNLLGDEDSPP